MTDVAAVSLLMRPTARYEGDVAVNDQRRQTLRVDQSARDEEAEPISRLACFFRGNAALGDKTVTILPTPTGWLRVRSKPGTDGEEIAKVNTGEKYAYIEQLDTGWTQIVLTDGTKGYVASKYVKVDK